MFLKFLKSFLLSEIATKDFLPIRYLLLTIKNVLSIFCLYLLVTVKLHFCNEHFAFGSSSSIIFFERFNYLYK